MASAGENVPIFLGSDRKENIGSPCEERANAVFPVLYKAIVFAHDKLNWIFCAPSFPGSHKGKINGFHYKTAFLEHGTL